MTLLGAKKAKKTSNSLTEFYVNEALRPVSLSGRTARSLSFSSICKQSKALKVDVRPWSRTELASTIVEEIETGPFRKVAGIVLAGGDRDEWADKT